MRKTLLVLSIVFAEVGIEGSAPAQDTSTQPLLIHAYKSDLAGVRAANPDVHLRVGRDPSKPDEPVLFVEYPAPTKEPGGRDVRSVRVAFDEIRPNPYFQPPDARLGFSVDVSDVRFIAFAPQDPTSGRLAIGKFIVVK